MGDAKERGRLRPRYIQPLHITLAGVAVEQTLGGPAVFIRGFTGVHQCWGVLGPSHPMLGCRRRRLRLPHRRDERERYKLWTTWRGT